MKDTKLQRAFVALTALLVLGAGVAAPAAAQLQSNTTAANSTQTTTTAAAPATTQGECGDLSSPPSMDQARLYAPQKTVKASQPGEISGGFQVSPTATCPVVVQITMSVPSGMTIQGSSDILSGGAGMVSGSFEVRPQGGIKDIRANVYSTNTGKRTVTADITYWPKGHKDLAQEIDGMSFTFNVKEPVEATEDTGSEQTQTTAGPAPEESESSLPVSQNLLIIGGLMFILLVAVLAMTKMSPRDINIGVKK